MPSIHAKSRLRRQPSAGRFAASSEDGFLLIEVIISAMLVGMIVVATMTGFDVIDRSSAEQRRHTEAAVLAAESQEQLRSDSATTLLSFKGSAHAYTRTTSGTTFTISQKATFGNGSSATGCNVGEEGSRGKGTYILISSSVTWAVMTGKPVTESSVITPPTGSALEVKVNNGEAAPTSGVTVAISYTAVEATGTTTIEGTTGTAGCVLFAGIPATSAKLNVRETAGIVNKQGTLAWPEEELTLAPNVLTPHEVVLAPGGSLTAAFTYLGSATYKHKQNNPISAEISETATGDTFVAENQQMALPPNFQTGSNQKLQNFPAGLFEVLPGGVGTYEATATTQKEPIKYPKGNLFPFPKGKPWGVYAGDCTANDPEVLTKALATKVTDPSEQVHAAESRTVSVPTTYVQLNLYRKDQGKIAALGANAWTELETTNSYAVTLTNVKCEGVKPDNETAINNRHVQGTTTGTIWGGHLEAPFQPFGEYEMCLFAGGRTYTVKPYSNLEASKKVTRNIYISELSKAEKEAARAKSEGETRTARENEEATTRKAAEEKEAATQTKREAEEAPGRARREKEEKTQKETKEKEEATKAGREATEKSEREKWLPAERASKEKAQRTSREKAEATEKTAREKRENEEATTKATRTTEESNKKKAEEKEAGSEAARITAEATTRKTAETKESEAKTKAIENENKEVSEKEVTVQSGKASC